MNGIKLRKYSLAYKNQVDPRGKEGTKIKPLNRKGKLRK